MLLEKTKRGGKLHITEPYLRRAGKHRILSHEEEATLSIRIREGDTPAWEELVQREEGIRW